VNRLNPAPAILNDSDEAAAPLTVVPLASVCSDASCPTVYVTNRGSLVIQGYPVSASEAGIDLPPSELLLEIPQGLLESAAQALRATTTA
jgi:hypothetical protein